MNTADRPLSLRERLARQPIQRRPEPEWVRRAREGKLQPKEIAA